eukprot:4848978-Pyramimonas_sp.AAC.1
MANRKTYHAGRRAPVVDNLSQHQVATSTATTFHSKPEPTPEMLEGEAPIAKGIRGPPTGAQRPRANVYLADRAAQETAQETAEETARETTEENRPPLPRPKYVGTVSVYVLVHRRSSKVRCSNTVATPGGQVDRANLNVAHEQNLDFDCAARCAASRELGNEAGLRVPLSGLVEIPNDNDPTLQELRVRPLGTSRGEGTA